jgi:hypothetical protein
MLQSSNTFWTTELMRTTAGKKDSVGLEQKKITSRQ